MDLHQRSYSAGSQQYYGTHSTMATLPYHTPPQTHALTQPLSAHTSAMVGLDLLDCHHNQQLPICGPAQPLLPAAVSWLGDPDSTHCYSNSSSHLGEYHDLGIYGNIDAIATTNAPFITSHTNAAIPSSVAFLSPPPALRKPANATYPRTTAEEDINLHYRAAPTARQSTTAAKRVKISHDNSPVLDSDQTPLRHSSSPFGYETGHSVPSDFNRDTARMLLELDNNIKRPVDNRAQREARRSTNNTGNATQVSCSTAVCDGGIRKQGRKSTTTAKGKYECPKCGMQFTRNSNCKSHMKIHDPNRKFPHKCTIGQCTKQFSRKTDLVRHVDSVCQPFLPWSPILVKPCSLIPGTQKASEIWLPPVWAPFCATRHLTTVSHF